MLPLGRVTVHHLDTQGHMNCLGRSPFEHTQPRFSGACGVSCRVRDGDSRPRSIATSPQGQQVPDRIVGPPPLSDGLSGRCTRL